MLGQLCTTGTRKKSLLELGRQASFFSVLPVMPTDRFKTEPTGKGEIFTSLLRKMTSGSEHSRKFKNYNP